MSSADETQQPSYHVRASGFIPSSHPGSSLTNSELDPSSESAEGHLASKSSLDDSLGWMKHQLSHHHETLPDSVPPPLAPPPARAQIDDDDAAGPSTLAGPSVTRSRWKTASSSSASLRPGSSGKVVSSEGDKDELTSSPPSRSRRTPGLDGPNVSTPPEEDVNLDKAIGAARRRRHRPVSHKSSTVTPTKQQADHLTPSKLPLSSHKPRLVSPRHSSNSLLYNHAVNSPSKYTSNTFTSTSPRKQRPPPAHSPPSRAKAHPPSDDSESFRGSANLKPHQQLKAMFDQAQKSKPSPSSYWKERPTHIDPEAEQLPKEMRSIEAAAEAIPALQTAQAAYHGPSPPKHSDVDPPTEMMQQGPVVPMPVNLSPHVQPTFDPISLGALQGFANLPPSSGPSSDYQGAAFDASQNISYGNEEPPSSYQFPATQAISPHKVMQDPSVSPEHSSHLFSSNVPVTNPPPFVPSPASQTSNSTHTTVPSNRRLTRVNPRPEDAVPVQPMIGPNRPVSLPTRGGQARAAVVTQPPSTAPMPYRPLGDMEPTQVDERIGSSPDRLPGLEAAPRAGYQDTFVDAAPMSPPPEEPATPRPAHATLPAADGHSSPAQPVTSSPALARSSPAPMNQHNDLQATYVDPRTLPTLPPAPRISPKTYARPRRGRATATPPPEQPTMPESQSFEEEEQVEERPSGTVIAPVPEVAAQPTPKAKTITPRRRGKRRGSESSDFTTGGGGDDSSPAPEDPEDYTYRPVPKINGSKRPRTKPAPGPRSTRASSVSTVHKEPPSKRIKLTLPETPGRSAARTHADEPTSPLTPIGPSSQLRLRVFGWWAPMKSYFPGTVTDRRGDKYHVDFDDNTSKDLPLDRLRRLELRKGDHIKVDEKEVGKGVLEVLEDWTEGSGAGQRGIKVKQDGEPITPLSINEIFIPDASIKKRFDDRRISLSDFGPSVNDAKPSVSPVKGSHAGDVFSGKVFLLTTNGGSTKEQEVIAGKIKRYGGRVADDWKRLFDLSNKGFGSTLRGKDAPFLISIGHGGLKPKAIVALASGIPCLAEDYIKDAIDHVSPQMCMLARVAESIAGCRLEVVFDFSWILEGHRTPHFSAH